MKRTRSVGFGALVLAVSTALASADGGRRDRGDHGRGDFGRQERSGDRQCRGARESDV